MKTLLTLLVFLLICLDAACQSHRFTNTFANFSYEQGRAVNQTASNIQVNIDAGENGYRVQLFMGASQNPLFDSTYGYVDMQRGIYQYQCTNCGYGELGLLYARTSLNEMARGKSGTLTIVVIDDSGGTVVSIVCNL